MIRCLWDDYAESCRLMERALATGTCDLSEVDWIYPTTLLPLGTFLVATGTRHVPPTDPKVADYVSIMLRPRPAAFDPERSYIPLVPLPRQDTEADSVLGLIYRLHDHGRLYGGESAFKYLIGEMVDNVYQHSRFTNAYVMAQRYEKKGFVEIAIVDDGITIGGSLRRTILPDVDDLGAIAIILKEGVSSKGLDTRGYGIRSNVRMLTTGLRGAVLIVSGGGAVELTLEEQGIRVRQNNYAVEGGSYHLNGTLVSVRIPFPTEEIEIYDYTT